MLDRIRLIDFKSFADAEVELAPLTVLLGANATGKSNFVEAIGFLHELTIDYSIAEILDHQRGGAGEAARHGKDSFTVDTTWTVSRNDADPELNGLQVTHGITCTTSPTPLVETESLGSHRETGNLFVAGPRRDEEIQVPWEPAIFHWQKTPPKSPMTLSAHQSLTWPILGSVVPGSPRVPAPVVKHTAALSSCLSNVHTVCIQPEAMRGYGSRTLRLGSSGMGISGELARFCEDPTRKTELVEWLSRLFAPELVDIEFIEHRALSDVMAVLVERDGTRTSFRSVSDGTLRFLGIVLSLHLAPPGSLVLVEDIASGLHPARIGLLVEFLTQCVEENEIQIVAATHSPTLLQWLDPETLRSALLFARLPDQVGTVARRLGDIESFDEVIESRGIEELFSTSWLEMAL